LTLGAVPAYAGGGWALRPRPVALAGIERFPHEAPMPMEAFFS